jgi:hypothetical protein
MFEGDGVTVSICKPPNSRRSPQLGGTPARLYYGILPLH